MTQHAPSKGRETLFWFIVSRLGRWREGLCIGQQAEEVGPRELEAPTLARVLEEDDTTGGEAPGVQIDKWGFAPGEDDTQDLNLESRGKPAIPAFHRFQGRNAAFKAGQ